MRCGRSALLKQVGGCLQTTKRCKFVRRHVQMGRTDCRVRTSLKKETNRFNVTGVSRGCDAKLQRAAQGSLTPVRRGNLVRVSPDLQKPGYFSIVTRPA